MISVAEALAAITDLFEPTEPEICPISRAGNRVLADDVQATRDQPPFASSAMDGYAVLKSDAMPGQRLSVIGEAAAGSRSDKSVTAGTAIRIFTGAPVPEGAEKILIQEDCTRNGDTIIVSDGIDAADYIRPFGSDFLAGTTISAPLRLTPSAVSLAAAMNIPELPVRRKPVFALIPTGTELRYPGETPGPDQIISSNNFGLKAMIEAAGGEARLLPIAHDDADSLSSILDMSVDADCIVTLGGASVGDHDLMGQMARDGKLSSSFYKVAMRPGKPILAGRYKDTPLVGLPGNPVSSLVCGHVFLLPVISKLLGLGAIPAERHQAQLAVDLVANGPREHYMRASLVKTGDAMEITPAGRQDSSLLSVMTQSNALLVRPPHQDAIKAGSLVDYIRL